MTLIWEVNQMKDAHCFCISPWRYLYCAMAFFLIYIPILATGQNQSNTELQILVPVRNFTEFVSVTKDPLTNDTVFSGFALEVFTVVMREFVEPPIPFKFVAYGNPDNGTMNGTFGEMLNKVKLENYAGAAGEISILYSRTQSVDFTMPYLDTSISMLVRLTQPGEGNSRGIPVGRVTKYVVASSLAFSFIVALFFWFMEYRNDRHTSREEIEYLRRGILESLTQTRLVMILFFMVLLVLIACYTASQTSSLAGKRPSASFKNLDQLRDRKVNVGYRHESFIRDRLKLKAGIPESKLISLNSSQEMVDMLTKGTAQGGVDAIVADTPNLKILVAKYCDVFTIVPTVNLHAAGFGFAFYQDYPRLHDVSNGILKLIDGGRLAKIQDRTIGSLEGCQDDPNNAASGSAFLDPDSLWILIAGAVAVFLLMTIILVTYSGRTNKVVAFPCYLSPCR